MNIKLLSVFVLAALMIGSVAGATTLPANGTTTVPTGSICRMHTDSTGCIIVECSDGTGTTSCSPVGGTTTMPGSSTTTVTTNGTTTTPTNDTTTTTDSDTTTVTTNGTTTVPTDGTTTIPTDVGTTTIQTGDTTTVPTNSTTTVQTGGVTTETVIEGDLIVSDSKLVMKTSMGQKQINVMPEDAVKTSGISGVTKIELKEQSQKPVYSVTGVRQAKLFSVIPVSVQVSTEVDAGTGSIISISKPWWSFLAW